MEQRGIPEGWDADELPALAIGDWRFYYIWDTKERSSVMEDNLVLKGDQVMSEVEDGLAVFLLEHNLRENPNAIPPARLAAQIGMFLIRGESRRSCQFLVIKDPVQDAREYQEHHNVLHPPETQIEGKQLVHRAWIEHGGALYHLVVTSEPDGTVQAEFAERLLRD